MEHNTEFNDHEAGTGDANPDTPPVGRHQDGDTSRPQRHHWLNTLVGLVDSAFCLTDEEQFHCSRIVGWLLDQLDVPGRGVPAELPMPLVLEVTSGFYTLNLTSRIDSGVVRPVRAANDGDYVVPLEMWRAALLRMVTTAYPELDPAEKMLASKTFDDLLAGIGVPDRAPAFVPEDVVRATRTEMGQ